MVLIAANPIPTVQLGEALRETTTLLLMSLQAILPYLIVS